ncbi:MAG: hypothetical protein IKD72_02230, partial [Clostridia bacterium]|nr:hypothetical protein [Clostridia bacterium]
KSRHSGNLPEVSNLLCFKGFDIILWPKKLFQKHTPVDLLFYFSHRMAVFLFPSDKRHLETNLEECGLSCISFVLRFDAYGKTPSMILLMRITEGVFQLFVFTVSFAIRISL